MLSVWLSHNLNIIEGIKSFTGKYLALSTHRTYSWQNCGDVVTHFTALLSSFFGREKKKKEDSDGKSTVSNQNCVCEWGWLWLCSHWGMDYATQQRSTMHGPVNFRRTNSYSLFFISFKPVFLPFCYFVLLLPRHVLYLTCSRESHKILRGMKETDNFREWNMDG